MPRRRAGYRPRSTTVTGEAVAQLRSALEHALAPRSLEIIDDSARHAGHAGARGGGHYRVTLVADAFRGRSRLERSRKPVVSGCS